QGRNGQAGIEAEARVDRRPQRLDARAVLRIAGREQQLHRRAQLLVLRVAAGGVADAEQVGLARMLELPDLLRGGQALVGQRVVVAAQRAAGGGQRRGRAVVERGGVGGEGQAVVAGRVGIVGVVDLAVGL